MRWRLFGGEKIENTHFIFEKTSVKKSEIQNPKSEVVKAWLLLALGVVCIAMAAIFVKWAKTDPVSTGFFRMVFACLGALPFLVFQQKKKLQTLEIGSKTSFFDIQKVWPALAAGGLWGINLALWNTAVAQGQATLATLLNNLAPIWAGLFALYFFREKLSKNYWPGVAVALAGVVLAFWNDLFSGHLTIEKATFLAAPTSILYAANIQFQRRARQNGLAALELMFWVSAASGAVLFLVGLAKGSPFWGFSTEQWAVFVGIGVVSSLVGWTAIGYALGHLPASTAQVALLNQAVMTAVFDFFFFGKNLSGIQMIGGAVILTGLAIVVWRKKG